MYNCFFNADSFIDFSTQRRGGAETQHLLEKTETLQLTLPRESTGWRQRKRLSIVFEVDFTALRGCKTGLS